MVALSAALRSRLADLAEADARTLRLRIERYGPDLRESLRVVYPGVVEETYDRLIGLAIEAYVGRDGDLRELDEKRLLNPDWLQRPEMIGYVAYTDRFNHTLAGVAEKLDYLESLGVTYLHLMPLLMPRPGESDGGYAVMDYRSVRPDLGTMADLTALARKLRERGMSLELDLVLNHVAREHEWARRARAGEQKYRDYFFLYPDRTMPDAYEATLPEIFPDFAPGSFSWDDEADAWVWTTFNSYQWDVNWSNPDVMVEYADVICYLANAGVEVLRLDAIAFIWKRMGTDCQNQPEVHHLTRILRSVLRIVAPAAAFKAEAIVGPADLIPYLGVGEHHGKVSDLAYHNTLMVQMWSALASRSTRLMEVALSAFPPKPTTTTWGTYIRCHDDIGWAVSDADAAAAGLDPWAHRAFLSDFYSGEHPGSFARGLVFQHNPLTNDRRISGTLASLAGLETALVAGDRGRIDDAIARIFLLNAVMLGYGGVPLLYMGDEIGMTNDYSYEADCNHAADNRWAHRPLMDWDRAAAAVSSTDTPEGRIRAGVDHLLTVRKATPHLHAEVESRIVHSPDERILVLRRDHPLGAMLQVYNLSENHVEFDLGVLRGIAGDRADERISGYAYDLTPASFTIRPYQALWLTAG
jgi:amylosucrase